MEPKKVNDVNLPSDPIEFGEFIYGGINSVRAAVANNVGRTINFFTNDAISNKYKVEGGILILETGVPKESFKEKVVNGSFDLATIAMAAAGGPKGALIGKGGKAPAIKAIEEVKDAAKIEARAARLSMMKQRPGMDATKAGKSATVDLNKAKNKGKTICETFGIETIPAKKDTKGVSPPLNRTEIDHIKKRREGGSGTPDNLRVRCRECNNGDR